MRSILVANETLFAVSARLLGGAMLWIYLADLNDLSDPFIGDVRTLRVPATTKDLKPDGILS